MADKQEPRVRHAAQHVVGGSDVVTPAAVNAAATPVMVTGTSVVNGVSVGLVGQSILPLLWRSVVTAPAGSNIGVRIRFQYSDGTTDDVDNTVGTGTSLTYFGTYAPPGNNNTAIWNSIESEQDLDLNKIGTQSDPGKKLESITFIKTSGTGGTFAHEFRYIQM